MAAGDDLTDQTEGPPRAEPAGARIDAGAEPKVGDTIGRYLIERTLGAGGMGVVFAAHDPDLDRRVALKVLKHGGGRDDTQARARLLREARAMAKLSHPHVITVHEVGTHAGRDFVAMELIDGGNVHDWLTQRRRPPAEVLRILLAAGRGLAAAHAAGLVHRDFKPHNVLLGRDGRVVVTDFGLARGFEELLAAAPAAPIAPPPAPASATELALDATVDAPATAASTTPRPDASSLSSTLTQTGAMLGTPAYMAPEQFAGVATGPHTDQFAFCVALWEGLAGARPFGGGSIDELRRAVEAGLPTGRAAIPRRLRVVIERGLRRDPAARWPSLDALLTALHRAERRPRRIALAVAIAAAVAAIAMALVMTRPTPVARPAACPSADAMLGSAWSPEIRARLEARFASQPSAWQHARDGVDGWATTWRRVHADTCAAPEAPEFHARFACLTSARDELVAMIETADQSEPEMIRSLDVGEVLLSPAGCVDASRRSAPPLPDDPALRDQVTALRRDLGVSRVWAAAGRIREARLRIDAAVAAARALGDRYPAVLAEALLSAAIVAHLAGEIEESEALYDEAATEAEAAAHDQVRATALLGFLEVVTARSSDGARIRDLVRRTLAAIERAGDDPVQRASVDLILADRAAIAGDLDDAIARVAAARQVFIDAGDLRRAGGAARAAAELRQMRRAPGDIAAAEVLLREALAAAEEVFGPSHARTLALVDTLAWVRWEAGAIEEAHALIERARAHPPGDEAAAPATPMVRARGRVLDADGKPVAGATVYVSNSLAGDPLAVALAFKATHPLIRLTSDADGGWQGEVPKQAAAIAEHDGLRSAPALVHDREVELRLAAPAALSGTLQVSGAPPDGDDRALVLARRRTSVGAGLVVLDHGEVVYSMASPVSDDGAWRLDGVPVGRYRATGSVMTGLGDLHRALSAIDVAPGEQRVVPMKVELDGVVLDLIVRSDRDAAIVAAEIEVMPITLAERRLDAVGIHAAILRAGRWSRGLAVPVDETTTTEVGAPLYRPGDIHARVSAVRPGANTFCVIPLSGDIRDTEFMTRVNEHLADLEFTCRTVEIAASPAVQALVLEVPAMKRIP